ncbi:MAG: MBL fold metallo-hydrolase [Clostridia bacterium]|nr:MBL fold metallo-hydrolase [Clostridia bacterium]
MLKFCSLYSGSSGNCLFINSNNTKLLVDCGTSGKKVTEALASIDSSIEEIDAILVTHEHSDHIQSLGLISSKYNIPVYANLETWNAMEAQKKKISENNIKIFENDKDFVLNDLTIHPFSTPHDAANPCGFNIHNGKRKLSIATDLGHMDNRILDTLKDSSFLLLESNYDPEILKLSKYPYLLKERIKGPNGHLSNSTAGKTISALINKNLKSVMLGHLSKENNFPELAYQTVLNELMDANIDTNTININVANRSNPTKLINL